MPNPNFGIRYSTEEKPGFDRETEWNTGKAESDIQQRKNQDSIVKPSGIQEKPSLKDEILAKTDETLCPKYENGAGEEIKSGEHINLDF
ncbi:hypothetical protein AMTR_s00012p00200950 [Amborella trichopoda]|uniref:Uncharacterized protein n=1 Tax=Amborella trichopoda TaxID=13333 RepID=W1PJK4_AMBTC|nr:hypothetical protein AMTR_s00012p00200950 [Amborella trichopoda]